MAKPVLVYVGHSYHQKTLSTAFFIDMLRQRYNVVTIWDEGWRATGPHTDAQAINAHRPEIVVFFQTLLTRKEMRRISCRQLFLVPMHDYVVGHPNYPWRKLLKSGIQLVNFCAETHKFFCKLGYESKLAQYWPPPQPTNINNDNNQAVSIFFWPRRHEIGWSALKALLGDVRPKRIVLRVAPDPGETVDLPTVTDIHEYRIEIVNGWLDKNRYLELLKSCNIFMAPRPYEGIGQAFLEAMSLGIAVVAPNLPTMNEYIRHAENSYLYDLQSLKPLSFTGLTKVRQQALLDVQTGHRAWQLQQEMLLDYLRSTGNAKSSIGWRLRGWLRQ